MAVLYSWQQFVDCVCQHWWTRHERQVAHRIWIKLACWHGRVDGRQLSLRSNCNGRRPWECCIRWPASPRHRNAVSPPKLVPEQVILAAIPCLRDWASVHPANVKIKMTCQQHSQLQSIKRVLRAAVLWHTNKQACLIPRPLVCCSKN